MIILQDSREQNALEFLLDDIVTEQRVEYLPFGDYRCEYTNGWRPPFVFERKSLGDLFGTMGKGHRRFKAEMAKAKEADCKIILICEESFTDVARGFSHSSISGKTMLQKLFTLRIRYDLETVFCNSRWEMQEYIKQFYSAIGRDYVAKTVERKARMGSSNKKVEQGPAHDAKA